jgi:membrane protein required for colicin V production
MNAFDAVVTAVAILAIVMGFRSGLLRSLATILGYLVAAPAAVAITPHVATFVLGLSPVSQDTTWIVLFCVFMAIGIGISALFRTAVNEFIGPEISPFDRVAGAALGAVRIGLIAVLIVAVFDRIIPADLEPPFLAGSRLRPYLSAVARKGLQSLPPEVDAYIDRLKRERGL